MTTFTYVAALLLATLTFTKAQNVSTYEFLSVSPSAFGNVGSTDLSTETRHNSTYSRSTS